MFPKINPKQTEVLIKLEGGETTTIEKPSVSVIEMQGQKTYQVTGGVEKTGEEEGGASDADVNLVASQAGVSEEAAKEALKKSDGDIAAAIMSLTK
jgi:nascent polypeptide-associated complex subunit alpha